MCEKIKNFFVILGKNICCFWRNIRDEIKLKAVTFRDLLERININDKNRYSDLTPDDEIKNGEEYFNALHWALNNNKIKNIALSGPYGSGKSSIIQSYLKLHPSVKAINISLAAFDVKEENNPELEKELEIGILKQLFYKVDANRIPQSRYRKLYRDTLIRYIVIIIALALVTIMSLSMLMPEKVTKVIKTLQNNGQYWGLSGVQTVSVIVINCFVVLVIASYMVRWFKTHFRIREITFADKIGAAAEKDNEESIFNRNMDEIIYFFEATKYNVVFLEDLDRFDNPEIFVKLRELNIILNNYDQIKRRIVFVYAIKDDMFTDAERTKFFDFVIPVVPIVNATNSVEILRQKLAVKKSNAGICKSEKYNISASFITMISPYIEDMRILTNICNEFVVYKNTLGDIDLKDENMFSMITFKNLFPKAFSDLEAEKGIVKEAFRDKKRFIEEKNHELKEKNIELQNIQERIANDILNDCTELKAAFLNYLTDNKGPFKYAGTLYGSKYYTDVMAVDFDLESFKKKSLTVYYYNANNGTVLNRRIENIEQEEEGQNYFERFKYLKNSTEERQNTIRLQIEQNEKTINSLKMYTLKQLIEKFGVDSVLSSTVKSNKLLVFLLRKGYINENYAEYINYFYPNSITKDEMNFLLSIRNFENIGDFTYPLKNLEQIVERIEDYEFEQQEILNFSLVDYMLEKNISSLKFEHLFEQLSDHSVMSQKFIKDYYARGKNTKIFVKTLCEYNQEFWKDLMDDSTISIDTLHKYLITIMCNLDIDTILTLNVKNEKSEKGLLYDFIIEQRDILQRWSLVPLSRIKEIIRKMGLMFEDIQIDGVDRAVLEYVFDNSYFHLTPQMINCIFEIKNPERLACLDKANYQTICELGYEPLLNIIYSDFENYVRRFVVDLKSNNGEGIEAVEDILERLIGTNIELCLEVIRKEPVKWNCFNECCKGCTENKEEVKTIWTYILDHSRIAPSWLNFYEFYCNYGLSQSLICFVEKYIDKFIRDRERSCVTAEIYEELLISNISVNSFKQLIKEVESLEIKKPLEQYGSEKLIIMIEEKKLVFTVEYYQEIQNLFSNLAIKYILSNIKQFYERIDDIKLPIETIKALLSSEELNISEKQALFKKFMPSDIDKEMGIIISKLQFGLEKSYVETSWKLIEEQDKLQLLINQIDLFDNDELESKFEELDKMYHVLIPRSRHKAVLPYYNENKILLNLLLRKKYITSVQEETIETEDITTFEKEVQKIIIGWVKAKTVKKEV